MELTRWSLRTVVNGRPVTARGEALLPGYGSPEFVVSSNSIVVWDDGAPVSDDERVAILHHIQEEAKRQNRRIEIE